MSVLLASVKLFGICRYQNWSNKFKGAENAITDSGSDEECGTESDKFENVSVTE